MMSMISSLIDELRKLALWLDDEFYDAEATKVRDAADTIWQLRDDLQRANAENAKLRKLVHILAHCAAGHGCDICQINGGEGLINTLDMCRSVHDRMRELGIEV